MSNITLTIPNDDHIALRAFGKALEEMALAHGAESRKLNVEHTCQQLESKDDYRKWYEEAIEASNEAGYMCMSAADVIKNMAGYISTLENYGSAMYKKAESYSIDTTAQQVESLSVPVEANGATYETDLGSNNPQPVPVVDSTGTPWDERIHSTSKALNADGTWRLRRKPKDMDELEWSEYVKSIQSVLSGETPTREECDELIQASNEMLEKIREEIEQSVTPVMTDEEVKAFDDIEPPVTPPGDDFHTDAGVVTEQTVAGIPPLPVPPPVVVPPAPVTDDWTFPKLMTFLTERQGKIDVATVNMLLAQDGIASLPELNAHPDKIGPFVARVKAHLGE